MARVGPGIQPNKRLIFRGPPLSKDPDNQYRGFRRELIFDDFFRRGNGLLGPDWKNFNGTPTANNLNIVALGSVMPGLSQGSSTDIVMVPSNAVFPSDQWAETAIITNYAGGATGDGPGLVVRASDTQNSYYGVVFRQATSLLTFRHRVNGTIVQQYSIRSTLALNDLIRLEAQGDTLRIRRNGILVLEWTINSNQIYGGRPGLLWASPTSSANVAPLFGPFFAGGFSPLGTTASDGIPSNGRRGPGKQPVARRIFQSSPRGITPDKDVGTPKDPIGWRSGPGKQPRKRFMFQYSKRSTSPIGPDSPVAGALHVWIGTGLATSTPFGTYVSML